MIVWIFKILLGKQASAWILSSFTDDKGEASARRISAFFFNTLFAIGHMSFFYIMYTASDTAKHDLVKYSIYLLIVDVVAGLFYMGLVTWQNIQMGIEALKSTKIGPEKIVQQQIEVNTENTNIKP